MDLANGTHDYTLNRPISVHFKGEGDREVILLTMYEPTRQHVKQSARLKQMIMGAMLEISEKQGEQAKTAEQVQENEEEKPLHNKTDEEHETESEQLFEAMKACLMLSEKLDLGDFVEYFIEMCLRPTKKPLILCDNEVRIKDLHFDEMSADDVTDLAIAYASFFFMPSAMQDKE